MRSHRREEQGFFTLWLIGLCLTLFFFAGVAVDGWRIFTERRSAVAIADGAAVAGTKAVDVPYFQATGSAALIPGGSENPDSGYTAACAYLIQELTPSPSTCSDARFDITYTGPDAAHPTGVQVKLNRSVPLTLMRILPTTRGSFSASFDFTSTENAKAQCVRPDGTACS